MPESPSTSDRRRFIGQPGDEQTAGAGLRLSISRRPGSRDESIAGRDQVKHERLTSPKPPGLRRAI